MKSTEYGLDNKEFLNKPKGEVKRFTEGEDAVVPGDFHLSYEGMKL